VISVIADAFPAITEITRKTGRSRTDSDRLVRERRFFSCFRTPADEAPADIRKHEIDFRLRTAPVC